MLTQATARGPLLVVDFKPDRRWLGWVGLFALLGFGGLIVSQLDFESIAQTSKDLEVVATLVAQDPKAELVETQVEFGSSGEHITIGWWPTEDVDSVEALEAASDQLWARIAPQMPEVRTPVTLQVVVTTESGRFIQTLEEQTFQKTYRQRPLPSMEELAAAAEVEANAKAEAEDTRHPLHRDLDTLCEIVADYGDDAVTNSTAQQAMAQEIADRCRSKEFTMAFEAAGKAAPKDRHALLQDAASGVGATDWSCPALRRLYVLE